MTAMRERIPCEWRLVGLSLIKKHQGEERPCVNGRFLCVYQVPALWKARQGDEWDWRDEFPPLLDSQALAWDPERF
jgi:hypothetical protein